MCSGCQCQINFKNQYQHVQIAVGPSHQKFWFAFDSKVYLNLIQISWRATSLINFLTPVSWLQCCKCSHNSSSPSKDCEREKEHDLREWFDKRRRTDCDVFRILLQYTCNFNVMSNPNQNASNAFIISVYVLHALSRIHQLVISCYRKSCYAHLLPDINN